MSGSVQCPHSAVQYALNLAAFGDTNIRYLEIKAVCTICDAPMVFMGLPVGISPTLPTASIGGDEVSLPVMFGDEVYDGRATSLSVTVST
jgi:hypothetical protein